jgi:hypothetical protein
MVLRRSTILRFMPEEPLWEDLAAILNSNTTRSAERLL